MSIVTEVKLRKNDTHTNTTMDIVCQIHPLNHDLEARCESSAQAAIGEGFRVMITLS